MARLTDRLAPHFAACSAALVAAAVHAEVIYAPVDWPVPANIDGRYFNVETRQSGTSAEAVPGWDLNPYSSSSLTWFVATGSGAMRLPGATTGPVANLEPGTSVDAAESFTGGTVTVGTSPGNWRLNSINYFGFRFVAESGQTHYGWGAFQVGATINGNDRRILEIAWESEPGTGITVGDRGTPPPYDACASTNPPIFVGANTLYVDRATAEDRTVQGPGCTFVMHRANAFRFTPSVTGTYSFDTCASGAATRLALLNDCGPSATVLVCNDDACGSGSRVDAGLEAGVTYFVAVGGESSSSMLPELLRVDVSAPLVNGCVSAEAVGVGSLAFDTVGGTGLEQTVQTSGTATTVIHNATWFRFVPTVTGEYSFATCGSEGDTKMALATACPGQGTAMATIAYNDDACPCTSGCGVGDGTANYSSTIDGGNSGVPLTQPLMAGQPYFLIVGTFTQAGSARGTLTIDGPPPATCAGDLNGDALVNGEDLGLLLGNWGACTACIADLNGDGLVNGEDLGIQLGSWGACP